MSRSRLVAQSYKQINKKRWVMAVIHTPKMRMYPIVYVEKAWNIFCRYFCSSWFEFCTELSLLNCRFRDMMMSRQCTNRIFLSGGSSFLHGLKSRVSSSRSRGTVRLNWCCVRANLWRTERLGVKGATPSEVIQDCSFVATETIHLLLYH